MKIDFKGMLIALLFLLLIVTNLIKCDEDKEISTNIVPHHTLDSFNRIISSLEA